MIALCRRFASLDPADRRLLLEAASWMALVWTGLRLLRFSTLRHILDDYASAAPDATPHPNAVSRIPWAIAAAAHRFPWATCLVQALAANVLLRRAGLTCELRIGVRVGSNRSQPLEAHAWIECGGAVAIGAIEDLSDFKVLAPARSS